jgi:hypothetical protein
MMPITVPITVPISMPISVLVKASVFPMPGTFGVKPTAVPNIGPTIGLTDSRPIV